MYHLPSIYTKMGSLFRAYRHLVRRRCALPNGPLLAQFKEKLIRGNEEWVLLQNAPDNDDRVRAQGVHYHARAKFREIIRADHDVLVLRNNVVDSRLELDQIFDAR